MLAGSSLTPNVALLSAPQLHCTLHSNLSWNYVQRQRNDASESKADFAICSSRWCVWIVQEYGFHVKPLFGYQFLAAMYLQIQSHKSNLL